MKKILSLFILGIIFALNCTTSMSLADFFDEKEHSSMMTMDHHNMDKSEESYCCEEEMIHCEQETAHECCVSPVGDINITSYQSSQTKKKLLSNSNPDIETIGICSQLIIEQNCIAKAFSPPKLRGDIFMAKSAYSQLVGIIKNNC